MCKTMTDRYTRNYFNYAAFFECNFYSTNLWINLHIPVPPTVPCVKTGSCVKT